MPYDSKQPCPLRITFAATLGQYIQEGENEVSREVGVQGVGRADYSPLTQRFLALEFTEPGNYSE